MQNILESLTLAQENYAGSYMGILRYAVPILSAILLLRCVLPLLTFRREPEIWAEHDRRQSNPHHPLGERHRPEQIQRRDHRLSHRVPEPCGPDPVR